MKEILEQLQNERNVYADKITKIDKAIEALEELDSFSGKKYKGERKKRGPYQKKEHKEATKKPEKVRKKESHSKFTPEINAFITKHAHLSTEQIYKMVTKKFGIKTTIGGLGFHISDKGLKKKKLLEDDGEDSISEGDPEDELDLG